MLGWPEKWPATRFSGGSSSGISRGGATELGRRRCGWLRAHENVLSTVVCSDTKCGGCGHDGDLAGGTELTAPVESVATWCK